MKSKITPATLAVTLLSFAPSLHARCSAAIISGEWGFTLPGTVLTPSGAVSVAAVLHGD